VVTLGANGTCHISVMLNYNNKMAWKYFNFLFLNIHNMRGHWDQIGHRAPCPTKYKWKSKNQDLPCQQAQNSDLIDFQIPFQFDLKKLFQHPWNHQVTLSFSIPCTIITYDNDSDFRV
jgi:hypothetical protein